MRDIGRAVGRDAVGSLRMALLEWAVDKAEALTLRKLLRRFDKAFRADPDIWGQAGYGLLTLGPAPISGAPPADAALLA